jgi:hypothetical protein
MAKFFHHLLFCIFQLTDLHQSNTVRWFSRLLFHSSQHDCGPCPPLSLYCSPLLCSYKWSVWADWLAFNGRFRAFADYYSFIFIFLSNHLYKSFGFFLHFSSSLCSREGCQEDEFSCDGRCLPFSVFCDGQADCLDGEDEIDCLVTGRHPIILFLFYFSLRIHHSPRLILREIFLSPFRIKARKFKISHASYRVIQSASWNVLTR